MTAFKLLTKARDTAVLIAVQTDFVRYQNMVIQDLSVPRTVEDGEGATFKVVLKPLVIVEAKTTTAPKPAEVLGQPRRATGAKTTAEEHDETHEKKKSALRALVKGSLGP